MAFLNSLNKTMGLPLVIPAALLLMAGCGSKSETGQAPSRDIAGRTASASLTRIPLVVTATGSLEAETSVMVSTRMMGWVKKIHVVEGQSVYLEGRHASRCHVSRTTKVGEHAQARERELL